ncbi:MAG: 50S ribosomal protein L22 [Candidatus Woesebacteria bacterium GW2011_GWB1_43_14]|uniref:Large ribosomal subunit protein uL22 n=1 Tax=Candidatus Woesebacteria bacterium GW2011_GWB1_43_14 TaxID=1618578 RepID=A0A0G1DI95_9BACT|nr:MAG: 50S ribosomal protein L22 [Candidatus Woesebacteria bacterium GW2011_GWA1_39_11b]KKS78021.1 MAG: 50S ribosomal protein L22 [Candidatus Woesebacteria bacterium GW2011_GWC1_42_9]KKS97399.1 MAG: 50S ribosomal protein L22 [Candidatus Woesebacteria bacterium GW2011_GWB1_43_14]
MKANSEQKYVRITPRKLRLVVDSIRKLTPEQAIEVLPLINKRAAEPLLKAVKSAVSNAKNKGIDSADLRFVEIQINEGPRIKRGRPVSRGRWHPVLKRMSHIKVIVEAKKEKEKQKRKNGTKN